MGAYIIAESGVNHNGSLDIAKRLIDSAAEAGADAVKFQSFKTDALVTRLAPKAFYQQVMTGDAESQMEMLRALELSHAHHLALFEHCRQRGIHFLSSPFDPQSADMLETLGVPRLKIASGEITNGPLLLYVARLNKPVILSTGMSTLGEIEQALMVLAFGYTAESEEQPSLEIFQQRYASVKGQQALRINVSLLQCTTKYPTPFEDVNLRVIDTLRAAFQLPVGLSDHTTGIAIPVAAVARGAVIIEKHLTLDRTLPGPDHRASLEPNELRAMVEAIRQVEAALGGPVKHLVPAESENREVARKSLVAARKIRVGERLTEDCVSAKRTGGNGLSPMQYWNVIGRMSCRAFEVGDVLEL